MKKIFVPALAALFLFAGCAQLEDTSAKIEDYTGLSKAEQICTAREVAAANGYDVTKFDGQLAMYGIVCPE